MPDSDDLTPAESALLIVLMAEARDVPNPELRKRFQVDFTRPSRNKLNALKYVESWKVGQMYVHRLGEAGWARCYRELNFDSPRARALGAALSVLFAAVHRHRERRGLSLADLFGELPPEPPAAPAAQLPAAPAAQLPAAPAAQPAGGLVNGIRTAYHALAAEPGDWVSLADVRARLGGASRADVDAALRELERQPDVNIVPESNQKSLSTMDRDAAVWIGGQNKHFLAIGV